MTLSRALPRGACCFSASADTFDWHAEEGRRNYGRPCRGATCTSASPCCTSRWAARRSRPGTPAITLSAMAGALAAGCTLIIAGRGNPGHRLWPWARAARRGLPAGVLNAAFGARRGVHLPTCWTAPSSPSSSPDPRAVGSSWRSRPPAASSARHHGAAGGHAPPSSAPTPRWSAPPTCSSLASSAMPARCASPHTHLCAGAGLRGLQHAS